VPALTDDEELDHAVALAGDADAAVVVVGTSDEIESEGFDRITLTLPGRQDELVHRVAAANPRTVVVVNAGGPVALSWRDEAPAILLTWFGGQELGRSRRSARGLDLAAASRLGHVGGSRRAHPTGRSPASTLRSQYAVDAAMWRSIGPRRVAARERSLMAWCSAPSGSNSRQARSRRSAGSNPVHTDR
jgi:Glycosyl hydrolase family 3 C-terminal domain